MTNPVAEDALHPAVVSPYHVDVAVWSDSGIDDRYVDVDRTAAVAGLDRIEVGIDPVDPRLQPLPLHVDRGVRVHAGDVRVAHQGCRGCGLRAEVAQHHDVATGKHLEWWLLWLLRGGQAEWRHHKQGQHNACAD